MDDQVRITVIGTGFDVHQRTLRQFVSTQNQNQNQNQKTTNGTIPVVNADDQSDDSGNGEVKTEDEFDIPAFLRRGR
jgi:hypothetical protein